MAWIVGDGFDYYATSADLVRSVWDTMPTAPQLGTTGLHPPRFLPGQCIYGNGVNVTFLTKTIGSNEATLYLVCAAYFEGAPSGTNAGIFFKFLDAASAQCTIVFESSGNILLKRGDQNGTTVATYAAAMPQDVWQHLQMRVVIDPTIGSFTVRKQGAPSDTFSATGLNTRSTANSFANAFAVGSGSVAANTVRIDDLLLFSGAGAAPNTWVGDTRAICLPVVADSAIQFAPTPGGTVAVSAPGGAVVNTTYVANEINWGGAVTPTRGGLLTNITATLQTGITGNIQAAIYLSTPGNTPDVRIAVSTALTNPTSGTITFTFPAGTVLSSGASYHFAVLPSVTVSLMGSNSGRIFKAQPYASGFPDPAGAVTVDAGTRYPYLVATISGNCLMVSETLANSDTDYVASATVGQQDIYEVADLVGVVAQAVVGVVSKIYVKKSDAGARSGQLQVISGATTVTGVDTPLSTTYTYLSRVDATDPATTVAWTLAGVGGIKIGAKVTA